jgi:hypothetical protein
VSIAGFDVWNWHFGDLGRDLILVSNAPINEHVKEAAKPTLITRAGHLSAKEATHICCLSTETPGSR